MKIFQCSNCNNPIYFENTSCEKCGNSLGYLNESEEMLSFNKEKKPHLNDTGLTYCANFNNDACNWLVGIDSESVYCEACATNHMIPNISIPENKLDWQKIEAAKRRLFYSLHKLNLPTQFVIEGEPLKLTFDFLAPLANDPDAVKTGHSNGLITLNIQEANAAHREYIKEQLQERYRTLLGHFRHEVGHFYWDVLIKPNEEILKEFRTLFGDDTQDYGEALQKHYKNGAPSNWREHYISSYATMHAWEDWAETWSHYMHMMDMLETSYNFGLEIDPELKKVSSLDVSCDFDPYDGAKMDKIIKHYLPLTYVLNSLNRSMGHADAYPFILSEPVIQKLTFIHKVVNRKN
ncbi:zinc-binding metallopeptidase family protein [Leeuwenhoekiella sp. W20_SRS_FM14]|uniref:zinc-binding metallopeptidase family protein n=1 Tax=Leeuwenhoekiella sp. W20_SRS_FM14 TaxID=3240270 RepID=UPI003F991452